MGSRVRDGITSLGDVAKSELARSQNAAVLMLTSVSAESSLVLDVRSLPMRWIVLGLGAVVAVRLVRMLLYQVRELMFDFGAVVSAWRETARTVRRRRRRQSSPRHRAEPPSR